MLWLKVYVPLLAPNYSEQPCTLVFKQLNGSQICFNYG